MGRKIKVEFSKSFRKPAPTPPPVTIVERHTLYVSNLPWKARSPDVKEFFSKFDPLSANVIFDNRKSAGYGFVSFGTKEEAEAALSELDGKVLPDRFLLLCFTIYK
jgi:RNA recognition motif-containing protein